MKLSRLNLRWEQQHPYMVVDATLREHIPSHWASQVIAPAFLGDDTERCPLLVDLRSLLAEELGHLWVQLNAQTAQREETLASLLMAAPVTANLRAVAAHLGRRMVVELPGENRPKQLRYFDPGTFLQLPGILGDQGMAWLLGPITSVLVPWAGHWTVTTSPKGTATVTTPGYAPRQLHALLRIGAVNRAAAQLPAPADAWHWQTTTAQLQQHIERAQRHGISHLDDLVDFGLHALQWHPQFDHHPTIAALLHTLQSSPPDDELSYQALTSRITPAQWQQIATDLGPTQNHQEEPTP